MLANVLADDSIDGDVARRVLRGKQLALPDIADIEVLSVLRRHWRAGALSAQRFEQAIDDLSDLPADRYPAKPFMRRMFELRNNVTPYDASYVALAESLDCPLYTGDARLAAAPGARCEIRLVRV